MRVTSSGSMGTSATTSRYQCSELYFASQHGTGPRGRRSGRGKRCYAGPHFSFAGKRHDGLDIAFDDAALLVALADQLNTQAPDFPSTLGWAWRAEGAPSDP